MRKFFLVSLIVVSLFTTAVAGQGGASQDAGDNIPNMGRAPKTPNGVGRLDLRIVDEDGNPVRGVRADLVSRRTDGFLCEAWAWTDARGVAVLPPLHMGSLTLKLQAPGFQTQKVEIAASSLDEPVRLTLVRKR